MNRSRPRYKTKRQNQDMAEASDSLSASTCIAHLILAGTSAWAIKYCDLNWPFSYASYLMLFGHSVVGAVYYGHPSPHNVFRKMCRISTIVVESCPMAFLVSDLLILKSTENSSPFIYFPALSAALPITSSLLIDEEGDHLMIDITFGLNLCVLLYFAINNDSPWAYGLVTLGVLNQFVFSQICQKYEVPRMDLVAIGLTFFCIFSINTLCDAT